MDCSLRKGPSQPNKRNQYPKKSGVQIRQIFNLCAITACAFFSAASPLMSFRFAASATPSV
jgi:hypothetical protein